MAWLGELARHGSDWDRDHANTMHRPPNCAFNRAWEERQGTGWTQPTRCCVPPCPPGFLGEVGGPSRPPTEPGPPAVGGKER
eukprot:15410417-Heterocapsa_arctica.AAC.1